MVLLKGEQQAETMEKVSACRKELMLIERSAYWWVNSSAGLLETTKDDESVAH